MTKKIITVIVEGGVIQDILDMPDDIQIHVKDFDCDSEPEDNGGVREDEDGNCYWFNIWN